MSKLVVLLATMVAALTFSVSAQSDANVTWQFNSLVKYSNGSPCGAYVCDVVTKYFGITHVSQTFQTAARGPEMVSSVPDNAYLWRTYTSNGLGLAYLANAAVYVETWARLACPTPNAYHLSGHVTVLTNPNREPNWWLGGLTLGQGCVVA